MHKQLASKASSKAMIQKKPKRQIKSTKKSNNNNTTNSRPFSTGPSISTKTPNFLQHKDKVPKMMSSSYVSPTATIIGDVTLGKNALVLDNVCIRGDNDSVTIGDNSNLQGMFFHHFAHSFQTSFLFNQTYSQNDQFRPFSS
jgi:UDP-3-O-[3-hydroxymyristoyl] glucosamine N-acyltransferase